MKKSLELDLADLTAILESFTKKLETVAQGDLIDLAARLRPVVKQCTVIDEYTKGVVKQKLRHAEGMVPGGMFKAVLKLVATKRLDQKLLKEEMPKIHAQYCLDATDERVTYELR